MNKKILVMAFTPLLFPACSSDERSKARTGSGWKKEFYCTVAGSNYEWVGIFSADDPKIFSGALYQSKILEGGSDPILESYVTPTINVKDLTLEFSGNRDGKSFLLSIPLTAKQLRIMRDSQEKQGRWSFAPLKIDNQKYTATLKGEYQRSSLTCSVQ